MRIATYIRLSDQDDDRRAGEKPESNSVVNQRALLNRFLSHHPELDGNRMEFIDDGHSGTNFHRPGIRALLEETRKGKIDCILVKDFSRFGRNYLEVGDYLEQVFPFLGVRFISVNDNYDSGDALYGVAGDLTAGVRNLINELYSRDLSQRVKLAKIQYARRGDCIAAYPIYGYLKDHADRRKLVVDPPAAKGVQTIFALALEGMPLEEIANEMTRRRLPTPSQRKAQLGVHREVWATGEADLWNRHMVRVILREERYTGKLIGNRRVRYEVGNPATRPVPRDAWIVVENALPPLISQEVFQAAQSLFPVRPACSKPERATALFAKKLHCGICGRALERVKTSRISYHCRNCRNQSESRLYEDQLARAVLEGVRFQRAVFNLTPDSSDKKTKWQRQFVLAKSNKQQALTAFLNGDLTRQAYEAVCQKYAASLQERPEVALQWEKQWLTALTRPMVEALIDDIHVYPGNRMEVVWQFCDGWERYLFWSCPDQGLRENTSRSRERRKSMEQDVRVYCQRWKDEDVRQMDPTAVVEINDVQVDPSLPQTERVIQVIQQMKGNPYGYRCAGLMVKTSFGGAASLQELLEDCLSAPEPHEF